jgi:hypothetical protein
MFELKLRNSRLIHLDNLFVSETYAGLLEGKPNADLNKTILADTNYSDKLWPSIPNWTLGLEYYHAHLDLPLSRFVCRALFVSYTSAKNKEMDGSQMVIVWYQEKFPPLIEDRNKAWLEDLPWEFFAADFQW